MIAPLAAQNLIDSHAAWWALAGVETLVGEEPVNWLAAPAPVPQPAMPRSEAPRLTEPRVAARPADALDTAVPPIVPASLAPLAMPSDWDAFQTWLAHDAAVPGTQWYSRRILPQGQQGAALMVLSLCPEMDDDQAGALHSGKPGALLDAMLRAIGVTRDQCYLASMALTRPPGGRIDDHDMAMLSPLLWHHLRLARPARLLLFGTDLARIVAATDIAGARGQLLDINQNGVIVEAVVTQHPLLLVDRPARKAAAWDSLKRLAQG